MLLFMVMDIC